MYTRTVDMTQINKMLFYISFKNKCFCFTFMGQFVVLCCVVACLHI